MNEPFGIELSAYKTRKLFKVLDFLLKENRLKEAQELCKLVEDNKINMHFSPYNFHRFFKITLDISIKKQENQ